MGVSENDFVILVPSTNIRKGFWDVVKSAKEITNKHKNVKIVALGFRKEIVNQIPENLKKNLILAGQFKYNEMPEIYNMCDLFLMPTWYEGLPKSLIEAMACEKPVLSTNVCGIPELIKDGKNGFLVGPKKPKEISNAVTKIIDNYDSAKKSAKKSRDLILEEYTWDKFAERINEGYKLYFEKFNKRGEK